MSSSQELDLTPALEAQFRAFESSMEFLQLRLDCSLSIHLQNQKLVDSNRFTSNEVTAFRTWQSHRKESRYKAEELRHRYWRSNDIAAMLDNLSNKTTPKELEVIYLDFAYRQRPEILLGFCNGYNLRLCINAFKLKQTFESSEARENNGPYETNKAGDGRQLLPLLLSLYRNQEDGEEAQTPPFGSGDSEDDEMPIQPKKKPIIHPDDSATMILNKIFAFKKNLYDDMLKERLGKGEDFPNVWRFLPFEGRNRLKTFLPLGRIEQQPRTDSPPECWELSDWYLVVNTYDKRPWIVFNPECPSGYGAGDIYYLPGQRMATFCDSKNMRSHARLHFSPSGNFASQDTARDKRRRATEREAYPLPHDFWTNLFAGGGTLDREITAQPFFQDDSFCLGKSVWDERRQRIYRQFDTGFIKNPMELVDDYAHEQFREEKPPKDYWKLVTEHDLHKYNVNAFNLSD